MLCGRSPLAFCVFFSLWDCNVWLFARDYGDPKTLVFRTKRVIPPFFGGGGVLFSPFLFQKVDPQHLDSPA